MVVLVAANNDVSSPSNAYGINIDDQTININHTITAVAAADRTTRDRDRQRDRTPATSDNDDPLKQATDEAEAIRYLDQFEAHENIYQRQSALAQWRYETNLTDENQALVIAAAGAEKTYINDAIDRASLYFTAKNSYSPLVQRKLTLLLLLSGSPRTASKRERLDRIVADMNSQYSKVTVCENNPTASSSGSGSGGTNSGQCLRYTPDIEALYNNISTGADRLRRIWYGWHNAFDGMRTPYAEFVSLSNEGARDYGFADTSSLWLSGYDAPPDEVLVKAEQVWQQFRPLYEQLHCYVRAKLTSYYGRDHMGNDGLIPEHLTSNMWAQSWTGLLPLLTPYPSATMVDVTDEMIAQGYNITRVHELAESWYQGLHQASLPSSFWTRSMLERPQGREVVCHASAYDLGYDSRGSHEDVRIKMCTVVRMEDLLVSAHELGHIHYFIAYANQSFLFRQGANDGFHEAIGDTIRLSATPSAFKDAGLIQSANMSYEALINAQLSVAVEKIVIMPFAYLVDKWRWGVFKGSIPQSDWNRAWWQLKEQYQGVSAPEARDESHFDPGAKYHVAANVPYFRYFLANILQFQFHRALCAAANSSVPLHMCSIFGSKEAGRKLHNMLAKGASQPWQDTLYQLSGERDLNASALLEYFAPLSEWLTRVNRERKDTCGWTSDDTNNMARTRGRMSDDSGNGRVGSYSGDTSSTTGGVIDIPDGIIRIRSKNSAASYAPSVIWQLCMVIMIGIVSVIIMAW